MSSNINRVVWGLLGIAAAAQVLLIGSFISISGLETELVGGFADGSTSETYLTIPSYMQGYSLLVLNEGVTTVLEIVTVAGIISAAFIAAHQRRFLLTLGIGFATCFTVLALHPTINDVQGNFLGLVLLAPFVLAALYFLADNYRVFAWKRNASPEDVTGQSGGAVSGDAPNRFQDVPTMDRLTPADTAFIQELNRLSPEARERVLRNFRSQLTEQH